MANPRTIAAFVAFAGAAAQMKEALIVNPFSQEDVADAIRAFAEAAANAKAVGFDS